MAHKRNTIGLAVAAALASIGPFTALAEDIVVVKPATLEGARAAVQSNFGKVNKLREYYAKRSRIKVVQMSSSARAMFTARNAEDAVLIWKLFDGPDKVELKSVRVGPAPMGDAATINWVGALTDKPVNIRSAMPGNVVVASFVGGHVYARFESKGRIFQLVPLGDGFHAVIEVDPLKVPDNRDQMDGGGMDDGGDQPDNPDDIPGAAIPTGEIQIPLNSGCSFGPARRAEIAIGIAYTQEALDQLPAIGNNGSATTAPPSQRDADHFSTYLIALTQRTFDISKVNITARLTPYKVFSGLEGTYTDAKALLLAIRKEPPPAVAGQMAQSSLTGIPEWRITNGADIAVLITTRDTYPMGTEIRTIGGLSPGKKDVLKRENGYSLVVHKTADAQLSFQHELGHHFGAAHDPIAAPHPRFTYGRGYRDGCNWRTIMAYSDDRECSKGVVRYGVWSSCGVGEDGTIRGYKDQNNVRLLNQKSAIVEKFQP